MTQGPPARRARSLAIRVATCVTVVGACAVGLVARPAAVAADEDADPCRRAACGDAAAVVASLADGYRKGTLDVGLARLYQDLRVEAGEGAALRRETEAAFPEPRSALGGYLLARLADRKDVDAALQRCLPTAPDTVAVLYDLVRAALAAERLPSASSWLPRLRKVAPDREETVLADAAVLRAQGNVAAAERLLAPFVAAHPDAPVARAAWAETLVEARRRPDAVAVVDEGLHRARCAPLLVARAELAFQLGDPATATACLDEAKGRGRPALRARGQALRCALLLGTGDVAGADAAADEGLRASPTSVPALRAKARCLDLLGRPEQAIGRLDDAIDLRPGWAPLYADKGAVFLRARQLKLARAAVADAKRRDADDPSTLLLVASLAEEDADWSVAERIYRAIVKADPDHVGAHRMLAGVSFQLGRLEAADTEARWLVERDPKDAVGWFVRGRVAYKQDRWDDAFFAFDKAIAVDPKYAFPHCGRGWVFEQQDKRNDAQKAYEAAIAADPKFPLAHRYLAEVLEDLSDAGGALKHYQAYLDLGGDDPDEDVKHAVERLLR